MSINVDHIVIGASTIEQGIRYIKEQLGVVVPFGGVHTTMGTHNALMQLSPTLFFEIVAINPQSYILPALKITQPRWFSLDDSLLQQQLEKQPRLLTWVVNSTDIKTSLSKGIYQQTSSEQVSRGSLSWDFALPFDRSLLAAGLIPYVLQWHGAHPAAKMADLGCQLESFILYHPQPQWLEQQLKVIGVDHLVSIEPLPLTQCAFMEAVFNTQNGKITLSSKLNN
ncbi:MAG: VOC family protein [Oceanospirillaceae bacterium]|nr:VOC family protein [Oceanospirillaceae bacterium]